MSATRNTDAIKAGSEFHSSVPPSEPLETGGHKPGVLTGNDRAPEFSAQTLPAGTAPKANTFTPNPDLNQQGMYPTGENRELPGTDSGAVHTGLGKPIQGQSSSELRHDGQNSGKKQELGLAGQTSGFPDQTGGPGKGNLQDPEFAGQRNLGVDEAGTRGNAGGLSAQEQVPESAETVARETS